MIMNTARPLPGECTFPATFGNYCHRAGIPEQRGLCFWHSKLPKTREQFIAEVQKSRTLEGVAIAYLDLSGLDLKRANMRGFTARNCEFNQADLSESRMDMATFECCNFLSANLQQIYAVGATLTTCIFAHANLSHANLLSANLTNSSFEGAILREARFGLAPFIVVPGIGNRKRHATQITGADFDGADLTGIEMDDVYRAAPNLQEPLQRVWYSKVREQLGQALARPQTNAEKKKSLETMAAIILEGIPGIKIDARDKRRATSEIDLIAANQSHSLLMAGLGGPIFVECRNVASHRPVDAKSVRDFAGKLSPGVVGILITTGRLTKDAEKEVSKANSKGVRLLFWNEVDLETIAAGKASPEDCLIKRYSYVLGL